MALAAGSYRGRVGAQAYPQNFLRQYDTSVYRPGQLGALVPLNPALLGRLVRLGLVHRRRRYRSIGLLRLFGL